LIKNKLAKAVKAIGLIIRRPVLLNKVLSEPDVWKDYVISKYNIPAGLQVVSLRQLTGLNEFVMEPMTFLDGGSLPTDLALLTGLAAGIKNCSYFEIGTWRGESVACLAKVAKECFTLCLADEEMKKRGIDERVIQMHGMFSKGFPNITHLRGDSRTFDFASLKRKFDLIFIDGDHHYDFLLQDTRNILKYLVHEKSIVVWHDYGFNPDEVRFEVLAAILDGTPVEFHSRIYHIGHTKCAILLNDEVESKKADFPVWPESYFEVTVKTRDNISKGLD
jgi:predicted O-methyltransferase YrrM